ncbi:hypothetical protein AALA61_01765 [Oscillospiraceae bacterium 42-9]
MKKKRKVLCVLLAVAVFVVALWTAWAFKINFEPRINSEFLTYQPFSGKLFNLNPDEITAIYLYKRAHSRLWKDAYGEEHGEVVCNQPEDVEKVIEIFNSYRYSFWHPAKSPYRDLDFGDPYFLLLCTNGSTIRGYFSENRLWTSAFKFRAGEAWRNGAWYYGGRDLYDALMVLE